MPFVCRAGVPSHLRRVLIAGNLELVGFEFHTFISTLIFGELMTL